LYGVMDEYVFIMVGKKLRQKGDTGVGPDDGHVDSSSDNFEDPVEPVRRTDDEL